MNKMLTLLLASVMVATFTDCTKPESDNSVPQKPMASEEFRIVPKPQFISYTYNAINLDASISIGYGGGLEEEAGILKEALESDYGMTPSVTASSEEADILLVLDPEMEVKAEGGYRIEMDGDRIEITAPEHVGIFYGIQTFRQTISAGKEGFYVRQATISDYPAHPWRSLMFDEARYFKGKDAVKTLLYEMARLKYNIMHWHLTDDQGWRLEIKKYPLLIEKGSKRPRTGKDYYWNSGEYHEVPHEGHYTQEDIKEIIEYAEKLHITIIPEVEILTHSSAAVACYSYLGTTGKEREVECRMGTFDEVMDISKPETMQFIHDVLDEVAALFPGEYIHGGGDEIQGDHWANSKGIQELKRSLGISRMDKSSDWELERHFFNEISKYLAAKGKKLMAWGEAAGKPGEATNIQLKVDPESVFMYWTGPISTLHFLLNNGLKVLYSHTDGLYFNTTLPKAYRVEILPESVDLSQRKQIIGIGVECWSEFDTNVDETFDHIFPLIAVYADTGWMKAESKDYQDFTRRLQPLYQIWENRGINYGDTEENNFH